MEEEDEEEDVKSNLTDYMEEYSQKMDSHVLKNYEPEDLDKSYNDKESVLYERKRSIFPN